MWILGEYNQFAVLLEGDVLGSEFGVAELAAVSYFGLLDVEDQ